MASDPGEFGYIRISRKFFETNESWLERREFSRAEAWIDLIQMAAWKDHARLVGNEMVELKRGELLASIRFLSKRWVWGIKKVRLWITMVTGFGQIRAQRETHYGTVYLIVNYDEYQDTPAEKGTVKGRVRAQSGHSKGTKRINEEGRNKEKQLLGLAADWKPNDQHRKKAKELGVNCDREAERMRDWAAAKGEKAKDWDARFRLWLDRSDPDHRPPKGKASTAQWEYDMPLPWKDAS